MFLFWNRVVLQVFSVPSNTVSPLLVGICHLDPDWGGLEFGDVWWNHGLWRPLFSRNVGLYLLHHPLHLWKLYPLMLLVFFPPSLKQLVWGSMIYTAPTTPRTKNVIFGDLKLKIHNNAQLIKDHSNHKKFSVENKSFVLRSSVAKRFFRNDVETRVSGWPSGEVGWIYTASHGLSFRLPLTITICPYCLAKDRSV